MNVSEAKYKIDKFTDEFIDKGNVRKDYIAIIGIAPELDSNGNVTYFTKVRFECINGERGFYYDAEEEKILDTYGCHYP
ncbi:hypothetical protein [Peribacillus sp. TH27]|uniref:hypothetical protein n=1 Tax=Peribacillus sp. TH27 TaxID=2798484 RepID=UPI0019141ED9|nr:hypothetical protein [Peribacillus sp. TH27]MBK5458276.1 hypothetical protein [Peribacillus sp. TH27]